MSERRLLVICYVSILTADWTLQRVAHLAAEFCVLNERRGITGCIGVNRRAVMQLLEGPEDEVQALYRRIALDPRHIGVTAIFEAPIAARYYAAWGMIDLPYGTAVGVADQIRKLHGR